jgi:uncharacterized membrane protein YgaE (UPF0421/DUF939 family)
MGCIMAMDQASINKVVEVIATTNNIKSEIEKTKYVEPVTTPTLEKEIETARKACKDVYNNMKSYKDNSSYIKAAQPLFDTYVSLLRQNEAIIEGNKPLITQATLTYDTTIKALNDKLLEATKTNEDIAVSVKDTITPIGDLKPIIAPNEEPLEDVKG